jgi:hypothetical protein
MSFKSLAIDFSVCFAGAKSGGARRLWSIGKCFQSKRDPRLSVFQALPTAWNALKHLLASMFLYSPSISFPRLWQGRHHSQQHEISSVDFLGKPARILMVDDPCVCIVDRKDDLQSGHFFRARSRPLRSVLSCPHRTRAARSQMGSRAGRRPRSYFRPVTAPRGEKSASSCAQSLRSSHRHLTQT